MKWLVEAAMNANKKLSRRGWNAEEHRRFTETIFAGWEKIILALAKLVAGILVPPAVVIAATAAGKQVDFVSWLRLPW